MERREQEARFGNLWARVAGEGNGGIGRCVVCVDDMTEPLGLGMRTSTDEEEVAGCWEDVVGSVVV